MQIGFLSKPRIFRLKLFFYSINKWPVGQENSKGKQSGVVVGCAVAICKDIIPIKESKHKDRPCGFRSMLFVLFRMCNLNLITDKIRILPYQRCADAAPGECSSFTHVLIVVFFGLSSVPHLQRVLVKYLSCSERRGYIKMGIGYDDLMGTPEGLLVCQSFAILVVFLAEIPQPKGRLGDHEMP